MHLIRIELHHETNYEPLHAAMAQRGFKRFITANDGSVYKLPNGTYYYTTSGRDAQSVRDQVVAASKTVGHHNASIIVAETNSIAWSGLERATPFESLYAVGA